MAGCSDCVTWVLPDDGTIKTHTCSLRLSDDIYHVPYSRILNIFSLIDYNS